jgi:hypothetical protein
MKTLQFLLRSTLLLAVTTTLYAADIKPGEIDPSFGDNGWVRLPINKGDTRFDSARTVKIQRERVGNEERHFIYAAGITGDRVAIAKFTLDGKPVPSFAENGVALSTRSRIEHFAGLELMDNGDLVVAYNDRLSDERSVYDFYIEVFDRNGRPKPIQQFPLPPPLGPSQINWRGGDFICDGTLRYWDETGLPERRFRDIAAYSFTKAPNGNLVVTGNAVQEVRSSSFGKIVSLQFSASDKYELNRESGVTCHEYDNEDDDSPTMIPSGAHVLSTYVPYAPFNTHTGIRVTDSSFVGEQLWLAGYETQYQYDPQPPPPLYFPWRFRSFGSVINAGNPRNGYCGGDDCGLFDYSLSARGEYIQGSYWDTRQSYLKSIAVEGERLYLYGDAETAFYPLGNYHTPIIVERLNPDSTVLQPRLLPLNAELSTTSAIVEKGLRVDNQHVLLGALNDCYEANNCSGKQDRFFVAMSSSAPVNGLIYGADNRFGTQGSKGYRVPAAQRVWAFDGALVERSADNRARSLIVVGDYLAADSQDPFNYDWLITKIRLPGKAGRLRLGVEGAGANSAFPAGVEIAPAGNICRVDCQFNYPGETELNLRAQDSADFVFAGWDPSSECTSISGKLCVVRIDGNVTVKARFIPRT